MDAKLTSAFFSLDLLKTDDLPNIAIGFLENGLESYSLAILAGEKEPNPFEARSLFKKALIELDINIPTYDDAIRDIVQYYCQTIISGNKTPYEGAKSILDDVYKKLEDDKELLTFIGLISEFDDFSDDIRLDYYGEEYCKNIRSGVEEQIKQEAQRILESLWLQDSNNVGDC